jgi:chromate transporter
VAVFLGFLRIGSTAFGGGSSTTMAMRRLAIGKHWLTEEEFLDTVVLARLSPGITIIAQSMLIGKRVAGYRGLAAAAIGLMLPAVTITIGLARLYQFVSTSPLARTPLVCVAGVAAGFAVALAVQLLRDMLRRSHAWLGPVAVLGYAGLSVATGQPIVLLVTAIAAGIAAPGIFRSRESDDDP